ncbi:MAG: hypothetical protein HYV26_05310, partial [Candidatus Hydrogenedentes bacterium]|nr:hypothetical protein [Candidatus Hydrogenedentota bacterium]
QAGRKDEAKQTFDLLLARMDSPAALQEVLQLAPQLGLGQDLTQRLGFLLDWHIVGPFPWKMSEGFSVEGIDAATPALDAALSLAGKSAPWREVHSADALGIVNLASEFGMVDQSRAYAFTTIDSPQATDAELRLGSDDGIAAWLNGEKVFENNVDRPLAPDQDQAPIKLKQGKNALLLEITQGAGGWMFCARLTTPDGKPLQ